MPGGRHYDHEVGDAYRDQVAEYLDANFRRFGLEVFVEVEFGKTVIGKNRRLDLLVLRETDQKALGLECKFQSSSGTTDEKIPYTLADLDAMWIEGALVYGGSGWSPGVLHTLQASRRAVRCEAGEDLARTKSTLELDHVVASVFGQRLVLDTRPTRDHGIKAARRSAASKRKSDPSTRQPSRTAGPRGSSNATTTNAAQRRPGTAPPHPDRITAPALLLRRSPVQAGGSVLPS